VQARGLVKRYGAVMAVDHVDLTVERGDVYGFLGPNGARCRSPSPTSSSSGVTSPMT